MVKPFKKKTRGTRGGKKNREKNKVEAIVARQSMVKISRRLSTEELSGNEHADLTEERDKVEKKIWLAETQSTNVVGNNSL